MNNRGPNIELWGTPQEIYLSDDCLLNYTKQVAFYVWSILLNHSRANPRTPIYSNLKMRISWSRLSKALDRSRKTQIYSSNCSCKQKDNLKLKSFGKRRCLLPIERSLGLVSTEAYYDHPKWYGHRIPRYKIAETRFSKILYHESMEWLESELSHLRKPLTIQSLVQPTKVTLSHTGFGIWHKKSPFSEC